MYYQNLLMDFIFIWHDGVYRTKVVHSIIPIQGHGNLNATDLELSYKYKNDCLLYDKDSNLVSLAIVMVIVVSLLVKSGLAPSLLSCLIIEITLLGFPMGVTEYFLCCIGNHTTVPSPKSKIHTWLFLKKMLWTLCLVRIILVNSNVRCWR